MQWKNEVVDIINQIFKENNDYEGYLKIDNGEDISDTEIEVFLDTIIDKDYVSVDGEFNDKDYFEYLKMFEEKAKKFISEIDLSNVSENVILTPNFYDIEEHYIDGSELYYCCGLNIRIE